MHVEIVPAPQWIHDYICKGFSFKFVPAPPPVFRESSAPTDAERALALELWKALDPVSRRWYIYRGIYRGFYLVPVTVADLAVLGIPEDERAAFLKAQQNPYPHRSVSEA